MAPRFKQLARRILTSPPARLALAPLMRHRAVIFMLHRFSVPDLGISGHDPESIKRTLAYLRRDKYQLLSLTEMLDRASQNGAPLRRAVVFTMDDGYFDQATIAAPLFAAFDCPVTTFVVTGFISGALWLWWDKIEYVFSNTARRQLRVILNGVELHYQWVDGRQRDRAQADFTERCKRVEDTEKHAALERLALEAEVDLPTRSPPQYAPMSWEQLRSSENLGVTFGAHTVTHPILSHATDAQSRREISSSWKKICVEAQRPVPIFAYPNGHYQDFGEREIVVLKELGFRGALASAPGYTNPRSLRTQDGVFRLPRFGYRNLPDAIQAVSGLEHFKRIVRRESD